MSKVASKTELVKPKRVKPVFKPDIRLANAIVRAIAFLQKAGIHASTKVIKKCITERARKGAAKNIEQLPLYLNRGLELGILRKRHGSFKLGEFQSRKRICKKKKGEKSNKAMGIIKRTTGKDSTKYGPPVWKKFCMRPLEDSIIITCDVPVNYELRPLLNICSK